MEKMIDAYFLSLMNDLPDSEKAIYIFIQSIKDGLKCLLILKVGTDLLKIFACFTIIAITK